MLSYICTCIVIFIFLSWIWPDTRKKQAESDRKHKELLTAVSRLERQNAVPVPTPQPIYNSAERARVLALGRIRDGDKRHPLLDAPYVSVANLQTRITG
jgi:hypothetical protein